MQEQYRKPLAGRLKNHMTVFKGRNTRPVRTLYGRAIKPSVVNVYICLNSYGAIA